MAADGARKAERLLVGSSPQPVAPDLVEQHAVRWRSVFSTRVKVATGAWTHVGFDWHAFSYGFVHALEGNPARDEYRRRQRQQGFLALIGPTLSSAFACQASALPWFDRAGLDVYVVPTDFSWTMVFTHEADCGPYFTTAIWAATVEPMSRRLTSR